MDILENRVFQEGLKELGLQLSEQQMLQFQTYYEMLVSWNASMNLTAITEFEDVLKKHFLDSLSLVKAGKDLKDQKIIDVGTGAGFPGIPLKIAFPQLKVVLLDSLKKRVGFLQAVIDELQLKECSAVHGRAEDFGKDPAYRQNFDLCLSRAVANLSSLSEYCIPFVRKGGYFISYKSGNIQEEAAAAQNAIGILGGFSEKIYSFTLPGSDAERSFVIIRKDKDTPKKYPRKAGTPAKQPLV